ncbi:MAG: transposase [Clostridia bacterium]|nr:transposase [Clostridia bacterium]
MAFATNDRQQIRLEDSTFNLTQRGQRYLKKSWAEYFGQHIFPLINEERFSVLYSSNPASRPNTPVNVIIGLLMLKELFDHTDDNLLETLIFDVRFQYALHTTSFQEQPISDRTLSRFRERLALYEQETGIDLLKEEMESLAAAFIGLLQIDPLMKRMDSLMVASSCKKLSRLELFYRCVSNMVRAIEATGETSLLNARLRKYLEADHENDTIYRTTSDQTDSKLETVLADALRLLDLLDACGYAGLVEYEQLKRVVREQTEETATGRKLRVNGKVSTNSLQNPSDVDATYREKAGKKHRGYVGNFVETFDANGAIITGMDYAQNTHSDVAFCRSVIEKEGLQTETMTLIADGAYGSGELVDQARQQNINLITTALIGKTPDPLMSEYEIDEQHHQLRKCPAGHAPLSCQYKFQTDSYYAHFNKSICMTCPHRQHCGVKFQKKTGLVHISAKTVHRAAYLKQLSQPEYKAMTRKRNAVEGIPSVLRRKYRVDHMPVRGYVRTKSWYCLKIGAINIKRVLEWADNLAFVSTLGCKLAQMTSMILQNRQRRQVWQFV